MDILENLNEKQKEAVKIINGPLLILAGAGSGKTRVLTTRIAYMLDNGINPNEILAITFTNKAAKEMKGRIYGLVGLYAKDMQISTFHSFGLRLIKENFEYLGYDKNFVIFDTEDTLTIVKKILKEKNIDHEKYSPKAIRNKISSLKNDLITPSMYNKYAKGDFEQIVLEVYKRYDEVLYENNSLDFDDLLILPIKLFEKRKDILDRYQEQFKYILIDEYQDTNEAQYKLTKLLASKYKNICCVGDIDQAIYGFRGANYKNILHFEKDYVNTKVIYLEENYRSTTNILNTANSVIKNNKNRKEKNLYSNLGSGEKVKYFRASTGIGEVSFVIEKIKELMNNNVSLNDMVILYRTNAQSRIFEDGLLKSNIPYKIVGGVNFYSRLEIKNLLAYLRLIYNEMDDVSLERIINVPRRGIGNKTLASIMENAKLNKCSMYQAINSGKELNFKLMIEELKQKKDTMPLTDFIDLVLDKSGMKDDLIKEHSLEADVRLENLEEFKSVAKVFEEENGVISLEDFLLNISLISDNTEIKDIDNAINLMTIHAVKGLEFDYVFLVGMEERIFPHMNCLDNPEEIEEERRLCYVAITRAKKCLFITNARRRIMYGLEQVNQASRFIREMNKDLIDDLSEKNFEIFSNIDYNNVEEVSNHPKDNYEQKDMDYVVGDFVYHENFGAGTVIEIIPNKDPTKTLLKIAFKLPYGVKTLLYNHKNLRKV